MAESINQFSKGMVRNPNKIKTDKEFYSHAFNLTPSQNIVDRATRVTEHKLEVNLNLWDKPYNILNTTWLGINEYVYFINSKDNADHVILHVKDDIVTTKYNNPSLNFQNIINSTYRVNYKGDRFIYFVDGLNEDRVINIDKVLLTDDIGLLALTPNYGKSPDIKATVVSEKGKLTAGQYFVAASFLDKNDYESPVKIISNPLSIGLGDYEEDLLFWSDGENWNKKFNNIEGATKDTQTDKAIKLLIKNLATEQVKMNVYLIKIAEETTEVRLLEGLTINSEITITGNEKFQLIGNDLSSIIVPSILYNKSEVITQKDNRLIRANTSTSGISINLQSVANKIEVKYGIARVDSAFNLYSANRIGTENFGPKVEKSRLVNNYPSTIQNQFISPNYLSGVREVNSTFSRDEVYSLGVYFELEDGNLTDVYHIPGRLPNISDATGVNELGETVSSSSMIDTGYVILPNDLEGLKWKVSNTAVKGSNHLGYWRCANQTYPKGYGFPEDGEQNSQGLSYVRHHRMPSEILEPIFSNSFFISDTINPPYNDRVIQISNRFTVNNIFLEFSNLQIPTDLPVKIVKAYYTYVKKDSSNKEVLGKGLTYATDGSIDEGKSIRQSHQLNITSELNNDQVYEFTSPESTFKFKESNINAKSLKVTSLYKGVVNYISKTGLIANTVVDSRGYYPTYLNSNGAKILGYENSPVINEYDYKQIVRFDHAFYYQQVKPKAYTNLKLKSIMFMDNNSVFTVADKSANFSGNQDTVVLRLDKTFESGNKYLGFRPNDYSTDLTLTDNKFSDLFSNYPIKGNEIPTGYKNALLGNKMYYDTSAFCTLLAHLEDIDGDILNLVYENSKNVFESESKIVGDSYIELMKAKRGYSHVIADNNTYGYKSNKENVLMSGSSGAISDFDPQYQSNVDTLQYNDYMIYFGETQINTRMRISTPTRSYYPKFTENNISLANSFENEATTEEYYEVYDSYSWQSIKDNFANKTLIDELDLSIRKLGNRMIYSDYQNYESRTDNYRITKANNYKDIITTKGDINAMFLDGDKLYAVTRDSIFSVYASNQAIKTVSGDNIAIGTGEFFGIEPSEIIPITGGFGGTSSKLSVTESPFGHLFVDIYKGKIIWFKDGPRDINDFGLQENLKLNILELYPSIFNTFDSPHNGFGIICGYDPNLKRFFITKKDYLPLDFIKTSVDEGSITVDSKGFKNMENNTYYDLNDKTLFENKSFTVTFDPISETWISYHGYFPTYYIPHSNDLMLFDESIKKYGRDFTDRFCLEVLMNDYPAEVKVFDSLEFEVQSEDVDGNTTNDFFDTIVASTENQSTGNISLDKTNFTGNLTKKELLWKYNYMLDNSINSTNKKLFVKDWNSIKEDYYVDKVVNESAIDYNKAWYLKGRLRDKYLTVRLSRNNFDNKKIICNFVKCNFRKSTR